MPSPEEKPVDKRAEKNAEKKARRKFRHEIAHRMRRIAIRRTGLFTTNAQLDMAAKMLTDRYMHKVDHAPTRVEEIKNDVPIERTTPNPGGAAEAASCAAS
jgi:hypothetical protein